MKTLIETAKQILEATDDDELQAIRSKWKAAGVSNWVTHNKPSNQIDLSEIVVPKHAQRQGVGSQFMQDIKQYADKHGATIHTTPSTDFGSSKAGLQKFYKSHGFIDNKGRNKDFTISSTMYRRPEAYKEREEVTPPTIAPEPKKTLKPIPDTSINKHLKNQEFHQWFGDSKVVTGMRDPIVAYHGTPDIRGINQTGEFKSSHGGIFFTNDMKTASTYAKKPSGDYQNAEPGIISAHLKMTNPYVHDHGGKDWPGTEKVIADAKAKGHDGVIIRNVVDTYTTNRVKSVRPSNVFVVFNPDQIKHATKNVGTHDSTANIFR